MFELREETPDDWWEVEALYDLCFAPGREALSSYRLRDEVPKVAALCLVARDASGVIGGAIRYWPVRISGHRALLLGPVAVHPTHQGEGVGALLIAQSLNKAQDIGWDRVMLVGDPPYYSRFGFSHLPGVVMPPPTNPDRVLGLELSDGAWDGITGAVERDLPAG
ncbi:Predicted N-acetyltransferase YhbS [Pseudooceanicola nitratireducens]|uniref:Predicted N-acetyltransferase YhbS n=1 Tax=Pseudooceanicola nitratireducens TaxID=517719 RepID=A0A1I1N7Y0_9RHOB|nr:N-acetyltransferase [Pseudooceanicola nitratireducens]SEI73866.1 Predicted N-acetyltransferase YhbS [Pseudooceanicola nitratireducens]SFC93824.1 Predicted N-acetyltransferase YhbS [Pseudooceanicola nitratireducens]